VSLKEYFLDPGDMVSVEENLDLEAPFSEGEVKATVFSCYVEGAQA
jgi:hypothetical protein